MEKIVKIKNVAHIVLLSIGGIFALLVLLFIFSSVIFIFGDSQSTGDLIKWGISLIINQPILTGALLLLAIYAVFYFIKHFES